MIKLYVLAVLVVGLIGYVLGAGLRLNAWVVIFMGIAGTGAIVGVSMGRGLSVWAALFVGVLSATAFIAGYFVGILK